MWYIKLEGNDYNYEIGELLKLFIESGEMTFIDEDEVFVKNLEYLLICSIVNENNLYIISASLYGKDKLLHNKELKHTRIEDCKLTNRKMLKRKLKICIYEVVSKYLNKELPWGILTGIRPTKIIHELMDEQLDISSIKHILIDEYKIHKDKIKLMLDVVENERPFLETNSSNKVSLYISIPFCPSRCLYCSFPSNPLDNKDRNIVKQYLRALLYEIEQILISLKRDNKTIECLYIGGGTPTTLTAEELTMIFSRIEIHFPLDSIREITVEAGRPDTITRDKLVALKRIGVERISVNPQTMNAETLKKIGRAHSPEEIGAALDLARELDFKTINMDLIIGLPFETPLMVENTMKAIQKYRPENLTVHTLAVKNSSKLKNSMGEYNLPSEVHVNEMLEITQNYTEEMQLVPYYMYRQKYMLGNLENIGYCLPKHECIYNIQIMEEKQTIIGIGAGATSKFYFPEENRIERIANVTNVEHYINRVEEMVQRKSNIVQSKKL